MFVDNFKNKIRSLSTRLYILSHEKTYQNRLKYVFINNNSDKLLIVFSGFGGKRAKYNYIKGLKDIKINKLYILDDFGYTGSYYLLENGEDYPEKLTKSLINSILAEKKYKEVYTAGSSKGGTCALYFGLPLNCKAIFAGAWQWNIGSYLHRPDHEKIFEAMIGNKNKDELANSLNHLLPNQLEIYRKTQSEFHFIYSKNELTYQRQVVDTLNIFQELKIPYYEKIESFQNHEDIGVYFLEYIHNYFIQNHK